MRTSFLKKSNKSKAVSKSVKGPKKNLMIALVVASAIAIALGGWWYYNKESIAKLAVPPSLAGGQRPANFTKIASQGSYTFYACNRGYGLHSSGVGHMVWVAVVARRGSSYDASWANTESVIGAKLDDKNGRSYWTQYGDGIQIFPLKSTTRPSRVNTGLIGGGAYSADVNTLIQCY